MDVGGRGVDVEGGVDVRVGETDGFGVLLLAWMGVAVGVSLGVGVMVGVDVGVRVGVPVSVGVADGEGVPV